MVRLIVIRPESDRFMLHPTEIRPFCASSDRIYDGIYSDSVEIQRNFAGEVKKSTLILKYKHNRMLFGNKIRELRDEQGILQRQLAALLEIDTPMFSKIERGDRRAKREQVIKLAEYFHQDEKEMLTLWLADKVLDAVGNEEELSHDAITVAQEQIQK